MAELAIETPEATEPEVEKTSSLKTFTINHPRTARIVGFTALAGATIGAMTWWKARQQQKLNETEDTTEGDVPFDASSKTI